MKLLHVLPSLLAFLNVASAAKSFAGSNLYYAAGLSSSEQTTLFSAMQSAGMKVLRVWLDGESTSSSKGTTITTYQDLEHAAVGTYDDYVLNLLDPIMVKANSYGIKLLISMHSWNALSRPDIYGQWYGTGYFYEWANVTSLFDNRLTHILNHEHSTLGKPWKSLSQYIIGFEAENEAMIGKGEPYIQANLNWQCDRATHIKSVLGSNSGMLVFTGGESWLEESVQSAWLSCAALDVISIHAYGTGDLSASALQPYVQKAQAAGKKLIMEEWGACYFDTSNNDCPSGSVLSTSTRNANIMNWASQITQAGLPWLYWQVLPNADPHYSYDYEIGINDASWATLKAASQAAASATAAFDFSEYLL